MRSNRPIALAALVALASSTGCSAPPPPAAPPAPPVPIAAPTPAPPEPPSVKLMMKVTLAHPRRSFAAADSLLGSNPAWQKASATLSLLGMGMASSVDLDRPAYLAMAENKAFAVSMDVVPGQAAKLAQRFHLVPAPEGGFHAEDGARAEKAPFTCGITPTPPQAERLRLVCSTDTKTVETFAPTLARMTADDAGSDVRIEMSGEPIRTAMIEGSEGARSRGSRAREKGEALGEKIVADLANDLDSVAWEVSLHGDVEATLSFHFRSATSPFVHALTAHPERAAPPTSAFWHLPIGTDLAFFSQGEEAADLEGVRAVVWQAMDEALKEESCDEAVAYFEQRMQALFLTGGPLVVGVGSDVAAGQKALAALKNLKKPTDAARAAARQALATWVIFEVDEPTSKWTGVLREMLLIDKKFAKCPSSHPPDPSAPPREKKKEESTMVEAAVPASAHLPAGTLHIANRSKPTKDATVDTPPAHTTHIFVIPDEGHTWIAVGDNEANVLAKVKAALHDAPPAGTLASRPGLDSLHAAAAGGGFVTAEGLIAATTKDITDDDLREADTKLASLANLPSKGALPVPIWWRTTSGDVALRVVLPETAARELLHLLNK